MDNTKKGGLHYGWICYAGLFICIFCTFGIGSGTHSIYNPENMARLGVSTAEYMAPVGTTGIMTAVGCFLYPILERKIGARFVLFFGGFFQALGFLCNGLATDMTLIWVGYLCIGLGISFVFVTVFTTITDAWFAINKGLMGGIIGFSANISTTLWTNVTRATINAVGFQTSYFIFAAVMIVFGTIGVLMIRNKPEDKGLKPIWYQPGIDLEDHKKDIKRPPIAKVLKEELSNKKLILAAICVIIAGFMFHPISLCFTNIMATKDFSAETIAAMLGIYYLVLAIYKIIEGIMTDNFGIRITLICILLLAFAGLALLIFLPAGDMFLGYLCTVLLGCAGAFTTYATSCMMQTAVPKHDNYVVMLSFMMCVVSICNAIATIVYSAMYDALGSYTPVAYVLIALCVVLFIFAMMFSKGYVATNKAAKQRAEAATK